ncbi:External alternative NAD(P)H-ubiquinone oxidoreductase B1, mitochondrial; AltName: Full=External alternative NADH dehydrogenase NDB1; AltName: Full=NADH:ubiquinone reductase (non-electrogenic) NDB1; Flags: Precursor [Serendipita indica DSM 11827]|uniref:Probable NADH dehydrogenase (Ubiquinone), 64 kD subunit, mitochondrial n=1 Tax=Serendipita indica (strain DSM 11827) TaxID=1109443 RepID=G4T5T6_SERID|nr:External alternative NAD(P)H-ubiquinone oxidoreductase B1, mitochondrial; AltName: Full=External alternative NADH dehydrogenase NDB1; AltName: Full=NADH:ubiquinone reductase (non-electrogenic) NDB1; Flags: Precursor [Serendipita indica DSM 11827]CCA66690.1 probable NADH dehydrogenase (ubiquinone), 64 kD subunit, mitochondrial [Serendipita indica DSM 11827]
MQGVVRTLAQRSIRPSQALRPSLYRTWPAIARYNSTTQGPRTPSSATPTTPTASAVNTEPNQSTQTKRRWSGLRITLLVAKYTGFLIGSAAVGVLLIGAGVFVHDAFTYSERHLDRVPVSPLALNPKRGGPKNLPIAEVTLEDEENEESIKIAGKPRLVIIGGGWGAIGLLKTLNPGDYHVTVIAPETFTTFTPLLPSAAVSTVQVRSLIEPIRKIIARVRGHFLNGYAVDLVMSEQLVEVETVASDGMKKRLYVPYDKLVIAVGSVSSTHGVPGLEHCFQLKTINDARNIKRRLFDNFETASLPTTTPEERKRLLTFVICGGGPTGVETAAEIYDLCQEDIVNYFPKICRKEVEIYVIQSRDHILNTYSESISKYAEQRFNRDGISVITNARVKEVWKDKVVYTIRAEEKDKDGKVVKVNKEVSVPSNFVLWSTGIAMNPFTRRVSDLLPNQVHKKAIEVDAHLRVVGAPLGTVYALGDAATIETSVVSHILELVDEADKDKDGRIDYNEWQIMVARIKKKIPMAGPHLEKVRDLFERYDIDHDDSLTINEVATLLAELGNKITSLPATAQVASQQGKYLGHKLSKIARKEAILAANGISSDVGDDVVSKPFHYRHLGSLAYIGNAAVFDYQGLSLMGGLAAMYAWRSIYWSEQVSSRTRALLMFDWVIRGIWGRDLSNI